LGLCQTQTHSLFDTSVGSQQEKEKKKKRKEKGREGKRRKKEKAFVSQCGGTHL
jgi:hypothetical protein